MGVQNDVQQANAEAACGLCRAAAVEAAQRIAPQKRSLLCPLSERRCRHPLLFAVLDLLVLLDQDKSTRRKKMHDRRNRFLLREVSRTSDWAFPARSGFTTFCHRKVAPKVSARRKRRGTAVGLRLKRYADMLAPAFSPAHPRPFFFPRFRKAEQ